jgi:hypothetical protein
MNTAWSEVVRPEGTPVVPPLAVHAAGCWGCGTERAAAGVRDTKQQRQQQPVLSRRRRSTAAMRERSAVGGGVHPRGSRGTITETCK